VAAELLAGNWRNELTAELLSGTVSLRSSVFTSPSPSESKNLSLVFWVSYFSLSVFRYLGPGSLLLTFCFHNPRDREADFGNPYSVIDSSHSKFSF
jgi:hypothetical protein